MAKAAGKNTRILLAQHDLSTYFDSADEEPTVMLLDVTAFQASGANYIPGLTGGKATLGGFFDGAADAVDEELAAIFAAANGSPVTIGPEDFTVGNRVKLLLARLAGYKIPAAVKDAVKVSAEVQSDDRGIRGGVALHAVAGESASGDSASVDNSASSANGGIAHLHVPANTRNGSTTVKVQHSVDNAAWVDLVTFASVGATTKTSERVVVSGTVNRYLRETRTVGGSSGSITPVVAFARL